MPFSLDKSCRIRRSSDYKRVYDEGVRVSGKFVIAVIRLSGEPLRVGITVSRKVGGACVRNLVKRRIREAVRLEFDPALSGWDVVLVARGRVGQKGQEKPGSLNGPGGRKRPGGAAGPDAAIKSRGIKKTASNFPSFSGIVEDIRRVTGRLSGIQGKRPACDFGIKGK